jgi:hypothetical protein
MYKLIDYCIENNLTVTINGTTGSVNVFTVNCSKIWLNCNDDSIEEIEAYLMDYAVDERKSMLNLMDQMSSVLVVGGDGRR